MITVADYFNSTEQEQEDERNRRGWTPRPPIAHTHRKPGTITAQDIFNHRAREAARTTPPTHRGEPRPILDELRIANVNAGRTHE